MRPDHYATLRVQPNATATQIRAAYLSLMREHHPDRSRSPEAVERTQAIIAAFKVLSDFDQRSYYDWDRRRDRERAVALATVPDRTLDKKAALVGAVGAALIAGLVTVWPTPVPAPFAPIDATRANAGPFASRQALKSVTQVPAGDSGETMIRMRPILPRNTAGAATAAAPAAAEGPTPAAARLEAAAPRPRAVADLTPVRIVARTERSVEVAAEAAARPRQPAARLSSEIASLDQFVMNFYGQSWRYGDAPKRAVLERTRAAFLARRGECVGETCLRKAYLDLMRDVSSIVETGKPETR